jgi:hypothetical protein
MVKEQEIVTQYNKGFLIGQRQILLDSRKFRDLISLYAGEFDWTDGLYGGSTSLANFFSAVEVGQTVSA